MNPKVTLNEPPEIHVTDCGKNDVIDFRRRSDVSARSYVRSALLSDST